MVDPDHSFHVADHVVFGVTVVVSIGIGVYYALSGGRQRTTSEYLVGGRSMKFLPVAISLVVSFESSIMMLGIPAEVYVYGAQWWLGYVGLLIAQVLSVQVVVPLLHPLGVTSAFEYLQLRFKSTAVRLLGSLLGILGYAWYIGVVMFGPAIALEAVTGFPQWSAIFVIAAVAVVYTSIGGLKAVIWTDVFQSCIMYAGMLAILIKGTLDVGGADKVWNIASEGGRMNFFNFDPDPRIRHTFWTLVFGSLIGKFGRCFDQSTVQRISATKTQREARLVLLVTAPCFFVSLTLACYEGIVAFAYYQTVGCDPLASKKISNPNQVIPFIVMDIFKSVPGMPGLFLASLFSASLSTVSTGLSSLSAMTWADFIKPRIGQVSEFKATVIAKISVVIFGLIGCGVALLVSMIGGTLTQIATSLLAAFTGPLTGLFLLGCFCPWANAKGTFIGGLLSLVFSSWLSLGTTFSNSSKKTPWLPLASTDKCLANHSASFITTTGFHGTTDSILNFTDFDSTYGLNTGMGQYYSTGGASFVEATTVQAVPQNEPQGIEVMYTLSYMWLSPIGHFVTIILGSLFSVLTGGNKEGEVNPRYIVSICDHMCCCLPKAVRKLFRCAEDYSSAREGLAPAHELVRDKEIPVPATVTDPNHDSLILVTELTKPSPGSDVTPGNTNQDASPAAEPQNGGASANHAALEDDVEVAQANDEGKMEGTEKKTKKEEE